jgi:hypothetical protein
MKRKLFRVFTLGLVLVFAGPVTAQSVESLPSWNDGKARQSIIDFVARVTEKGSPDFVPPAERIAVFDNDGTLWAERPMYFQLLFALERVKALAPQHPEWKDTEPFASLLKGDVEGAMADGMKSVVEIVMATHAGMTTARVRGDRQGLDRNGTTSHQRASLHRDGLSADAGAARLSARQRLQDLHRLRRRHRVHAPVV